MLRAFRPACGRVVTLTQAEAVDAVVFATTSPEQLGQLRLASTLVEAGAKVTHADFRGVTPLAIAASQGWAIACDYLLRHGAVVNAKGELDLRTPAGTRPRHKYTRSCVCTDCDTCVSSLLFPA